MDRRGDHQTRAGRGRRAGRLRVGTSGYQYPHWRGVFYPQRLPRADWFGHYAVHFDTVEINNTFYRLPAPLVFDGWRRGAPAGFCFALKFSRYATHMRRLREPREPMRKFASAAARLGPHLGPILVQLPPRWRADPERLDAFLAAAPARRRFAVEFRDRSWLCDRVLAVLERRGAALCVHDLLEDHPREVTAGWVYLRFHGDGYGGSYAPQRLSAEARRIRRWLAAGLDVYAYFNNDAGGWAVANARSLRRLAMRSPTRRPAPANP